MKNYKIISVESRKGGVGKTTAALNLSLLLRAEGDYFGLKSATYFGANSATRFGAKGATHFGAKSATISEQRVPLF